VGAGERAATAADYGAINTLWTRTSISAKGRGLVEQLGTKTLASIVSRGTAGGLTTAMPSGSRRRPFAI
jgi:hypothetical protein